MAHHNDYKKMTIDSMKENILAIEYCLEFDKSKDKKWEKDELGCLGIPSFILMCSLIDTIGSYFRSSKIKINIDNKPRKIRKSLEHFFILNFDKLFNLNLSETTITDFYNKYRSVTIHNNSLPPNTSLVIGKKEDEIFLIDNSELIRVCLIPLFFKIKDAVNLFTYYLTNSTWSENHWLTNDINKKNNTGIIVSQVTASSVSKNDLL